MKGIVKVIIKNDEIGYDFSLNRKYSFLQGDSATGKSALCNMFTKYFSDSDFAAITDLSFTGCKGIKVYSTIGLDFYSFIENNEGYLIVLDESDIKNLKLSSNGKKLNSSNNYFLLITRKSKAYIPYSYKSIYKLYYDSKSNINRFKNIYIDIDLYNLKPDILITEDEKSGYQFFRSVFDGNCEVVTSKTKTKVPAKIKELAESGKYFNICAIADGSAFGAEIGKVYKYVMSPDFLNRGVDISILLPESFEYLLLNTMLFNINNLKDMLENTYNYCDAGEYSSWEQFYTGLMEENLNYKKKNLHDRYLKREVVERVFAQLTDLDRSLLKEGNIVNIPKKEAHDEAVQSQKDKQLKDKEKRG